MKIKGLVDEDICNYKKTSMFIIFPHCSFKCDKENGTQICQNWSLAKAECYEMPTNNIIKRYIDNPLTHAIVCGGLEPFDSSEDLLELIKILRSKYNNNDDFVIYTGYTEEELQNSQTLKQLLHYQNIIIKYGRFIPNEKEHYDQILGVKLVSNNQYAKIYNIKE